MLLYFLREAISCPPADDQETLIGVLNDGRSEPLDGQRSERAKLYGIRHREYKGSTNWRSWQTSITALVRVVFDLPLSFYLPVIRCSPTCRFFSSDIRDRFPSATAGLSHNSGIVFGFDAVENISVRVRMFFRENFPNVHCCLEVNLFKGCTRISCVFFYTLAIQRYGRLEKTLKLYHHFDRVVCIE